MRRLLLSRFSIYFNEIAKSGSLRRAAEKLNIAPSALSRHLVGAESEIGVQLFERLPTGLRLTAAGELLLSSVRNSQRDETRLRTQLDELRGVRRGEVKLGIPEDVLGDILPGALAEFARRHPPITYRITVSSSKEIWQAAVQGDIDIGLAFNPARSPTLQMIREVGFSLGVVVDPEHPFAKLTQVKLAACAREPIILPDRTMSLRDGIDRSASAARIELHPLIQASSPGIIKSMVTERTGIALLTFIDVVNEVRLGKLVFVPLADRNLPISYLSLMAPSNRSMTAAAALMVRHLTETLDALSPQAALPQSASGVR
ncbi:MAG: LysR family transcriptional regulator [Pseudorhodoplanes sp.]